ncbi:MAG: transcription antitermination protein NusB [Gammaproteobacteria bacterium]
MQPQKRHWSRRLALQALYQWQISDHEIDEILAQYVEDENWEKTDKDYFVDLVSQSISQHENLASTFSPYLNLPLEQIDPIENAILLFSTYELLNKPKTPTNVIHKFVNGVLDKVAQQRT